MPPRFLGLCLLVFSFLLVLTRAPAVSRDTAWLPVFTQEIGAVSLFLPSDSEDDDLGHSIEHLDGVPLVEATPEQLAEAGAYVGEPILFAGDSIVVTPTLNVASRLLMATPTPGVKAFNDEWAKLLLLAGPSTPSKVSGAAYLVPVRGVVSSLFGVDRSYHDGPAHTPHQGVDIAADTGTPVVAANAGTVVFADGWTVRGNAVVVDHGGGIYSGYYHLSSIYVTVGQDLARGEVLGAIGSTGVATGPHLHWDVVVRGAHVDPLGWTKASGNRELYTALLVQASRPGVSPYRATGLTSALSFMDYDSSTPDEPEVVQKTAAEEAAEAAAVARGTDIQRQTAVRKSYIAMLGRDPLPKDAAAVDAWVASDIVLDELRASISLEGAAERTAAVAKVYINLLGRDPRGADDASVRYWVKTDLTLAEIGPAILKAGAAERRLAVGALYRKLLGREPTEATDTGFMVWVDSSLALAEIRERLLASAEYRQQHPAEPAPTPSAKEPVAIPIPLEPIATPTTLEATSPSSN